MLLRRLIYICIVLFSQIYIILTVLFLFLIQIAYLTTIIVLRPYKTIKNNAIDMINEIVYIVCIGLLFYYNKASHWNKTVESVFIYLFLGSTFWAMIIVILSLLCKLKSVIFWKKSKKVKNMTWPSKNASSYNITDLQMNQIRLDDNIYEESKMEKDYHKSSGSVKKRSGVHLSKGVFKKDE